jgi:hypothetical protein
MDEVGMDDYSALAYRIAGGVADVRGCLILSRDGLILGSYPDDETAVKPAWVRFASLGDPERSFVEFGDQVWVYVRRPTYGAFAVANAGVRPGLVIDQLEGILHSAEESRNRRDTLRVPEVSAAPSGKPRTSLHPSVDVGGPSMSAAPAPGSPESRHWSRANPETVKRQPGHGGPAVDEVATVARDVGQTGEPSAVDDGDHDASDGAAEREEIAPSAAPGDEPAHASNAPQDHGAEGDAAAGTHTDEGGEKPPPVELDADAVVDPVMLAKEFSGLLQVESGDDEATS